MIESLFEATVPNAGLILNRLLESSTAPAVSFEEAYAWLDSGTLFLEMQQREMPSTAPSPGPSMMWLETSQRPLLLTALRQQARTYRGHEAAQLGVQSNGLCLLLALLLRQMAAPDAEFDRGPDRQLPFDSAYLHVGLIANRLLENGRGGAYGLAAIHAWVESYELFSKLKWLEKPVPGFAFPEGELEPLTLFGLKSLAREVRGEEEKKLGVRESGLSLLLALVFQALQFNDYPHYTYEDTH